MAKSLLPKRSRSVFFNKHSKTGKTLNFNEAFGTTRMSTELSPISVGEECPICFLALSKAVVCPGCFFTTCTDCSKHYVTSSLKPAHCMNCRIPWSLRFLHSAFDQKWLTSSNPSSYRTHCKNRILAREKAFLPKTLASFPKFRRREEHKLLIRNLREERSKLKLKIREINSLLSTIRAESPPLEEPLDFVCACPSPRCRGLIAAVSFQCVVCFSVICEDCREATVPHGEPHQCANTDILTIKAIRKETKPCPGCTASIFKISGCDQMWCTQCRTAFSWQTGRVESGRIHNPHAIQFARTNHMNLQGSLPPLGSLTNRLPRGSLASITPLFHRLAELPRLLRIRCRFASFDDLRRKFVLQQITESQWRQAIFLRDRHNERKLVRRNIFGTFQDLGVDCFYQLLENLTDRKKNARTKRFLVSSFLIDMDTIRQFINEALRAELRVLGCKSPPQIAADWKDLGFA